MGRNTGDLTEDDFGYALRFDYSQMVGDIINGRIPRDGQRTPQILRESGLMGPPIQPARASDYGMGGMVNNASRRTVLPSVESNTSGFGSISSASLGRNTRTSSQQPSQRNNLSRRSVTPSDSGVSEADSCDTEAINEKIGWPTRTRVVKLTGFSEHSHMPEFDDVISSIRFGKIYSIELLPKREMKVVFVHRRAAFKLLEQGWMDVYRLFGETDNVQVEPMENEEIGELPVDASRVLVVKRPAPIANPTGLQPGWNTMIINHGQRLTMDDVVRHGIFSKEEVEHPEIWFFMFPDALFNMVKIRRFYLPGERLLHLEMHFKSIPECIHDKNMMSDPVIPGRELPLNPQFGKDTCAHDADERDSEFGRSPTRLSDN